MSTRKPTNLTGGTMHAELKPGDQIKVRDRFTPAKSRRQATVIEDRGDEGVLCLVHHRAARGGVWTSRKELVSRDRIIR